MSPGIISQVNHFPLNPCLLLEEPKLRQIAKALSWKQFRIKKHNMKALSSLRIHFEPPADFTLTLEKDLNVKLALLDIHICHIYSKEIHAELQNSSLFLSLKPTFHQEVSSKPKIYLTSVRYSPLPLPLLCPDSSHRHLLIDWPSPARLSQQPPDWTVPSSTLDSCNLLSAEQLKKSPKNRNQLVSLPSEKSSAASHCTQNKIPTPPLGLQDFPSFHLKPLSSHNAPGASISSQLLEWTQPLPASRTLCLSFPLPQILCPDSVYRTPPYLSALFLWRSSPMTFSKIIHPCTPLYHPLAFYLVYFLHRTNNKCCLFHFFVIHSFKEIYTQPLFCGRSGPPARCGRFTVIKKTATAPPSLGKESIERDSFLKNNNTCNLKTGKVRSVMYRVPWDLKLEKFGLVRESIPKKIKNDLRVSAGKG